MKYPVSIAALALVSSSSMNAMSLIHSNHTLPPTKSGKRKKHKNKKKKKR